MEAPSETLAELAARDHAALLLAFFLRRVRSRDDVDDLCQEVLERLVNVRTDSVKDVEKYLYRCAAAVVTDYYRKQKLLKLVSLDETACEQVPHLQEDSISAVEFGEDVLRALKTLPAGVARDVYITRLLHGTPFPAIAMEFGITVESARTYFSNVNNHVWQTLWAQGGPKK